MSSSFRLLTLGDLRLDGPQGEVRTLRRRERVLLVYLASRSPAEVSRAELAALLWGERDEARARQSLRQALFALHRALGDAIEVGPVAVALRVGAVQLDITAAAEEIRQGRLEDALARFRGEFLTAVDDSAGEATREWIDAERAAVRRLFTTALDRLAVETRGRGNASALIDHARHWADLHPWDESAHVRLIEALRDAGRLDDAGAWHARAREQLYGASGDDPSPRLRRLSAELTDAALAPPSSGRASCEPPPSADVVTAAGGELARSSGSGRNGTRSHRMAVVGVVGLVLLGATAVGMRAAMNGAFGFTPREPLVLAVGAVRSLAPSAHDSLSIALPAILTTHLARVRELEVVSRGRMHELLARSSNELAAARRAGATELLEGELHSVTGGGHRLELRRVDVRSGRIRGTYSIESLDGLDLAHRTATAVIGSLGYAAPRVPTRQAGSITASVLLEEGMRANFRRRDHAAAFRLFTSALERDSTFALAALYAGLAADARPETMPQAAGYLVRAESLAHHAPERDQLYIRAYTALYFNEPAALPLAESLAAGYPRDPAGPILAGNALSWAARYAEATDQLRRALQLDRAGPEAKGDAGCNSCVAYSLLIDTYTAADSIPTAIRVAEDWAAAEPRSPVPLTGLAQLLDALDRRAESAVVRRRIAVLVPYQSPDLFAEVRQAIRVADFDAADAGIRVLVRSEDLDRERDARWLEAISLRAQGRHREALEVARRFQRLAPGRPGATRWAATPLAVVLTESGHPARGAALFDSVLPAATGDRQRARVARERAWTLTLVAAALATAGDTVRLSRLADSIAVIGRMSAFGRDRVMHHHVRGLLFRARGDLASAETAFRAALYSPNAGYTRTNFELARVLLARGRGGEAVPLLQSALRGPIDGTAYYVTRTELREMLGLAFDAAGQRDSAAVQYAMVLAAWRRADPALAPRIARLEARRRALAAH